MSTTTLDPPRPALLGPADAGVTIHRLTPLSDREFLRRMIRYLRAKPDQTAYQRQFVIDMQKELDRRIAAGEI